MESDLCNIYHCKKKRVNTVIYDGIRKNLECELFQTSFHCLKLCPYYRNYEPLYFVLDYTLVLVISPIRNNLLIAV